MRENLGLWSWQVGAYPFLKVNYMTLLFEKKNIYIYSFIKKKEKNFDFLICLSEQGINLSNWILNC